MAHSALASNNPYISRILELNADRVSAHALEATMRREYFAHHPYHFIYIGCMDGRASHLPEALGIPVGCSEILQTAGARFSTAWPYFANILTDSVEYGLRRNRTVVIIVSSHFSAKYPAHGCRAFENDRSKAREYVQVLAQRLERNFSPYRKPIYVLPIELNTDDDSIVVKGELESGIESADFLDTARGLERVICDHFPSYRDNGLLQIVHMLLENNLKHVRTVRAHTRDHKDCCHGEFAFGVGRGFGTWLNPRRNTSIILFPEGDELPYYIRTAGQILMHNMESDEELAEHGALIIPCAAYNDAAKINFAYDRVERYQALLTYVFENNLPDFRYTMFPGTVDLKTWQFTPR